MQARIEVGLQVLDRGIDLLAEGDAVELVEHSLVVAPDDPLSECEASRPALRRGHPCATEK
jgi:hypothetical protein